MNVIMRQASACVLQATMALIARDVSVCSF